MNGNLPEDDLRNATREEIISALFANMVIEHSQMALMFLGKAPDPEGGEPVKDLETAKRFIDQLEMLAEKTKGNLSPQEGQLLSRSLGTLRMLFVQELEAQMSQSQGGQGGHEFQFAPPSAGMFPPQPGAGPANFSSEPSTPAPQPPPSQTRPTTSDAPPVPPAQTQTPAPELPAEPDESRKRFVKKY